MQREPQRWFEVTETQGSGKSYWRTNAAASRGSQVEYLRPSGWATSVVFDTEKAFLRSVERFEWREINPEEPRPEVRARGCQPDGIRLRVLGRSLRTSAPAASDPDGNRFWLGRTPHD